MAIAPKLLLHLLQEQSYALPATNAGAANGPGGTSSLHLMHKVGSDA